MTCYHAVNSDELIERKCVCGGYPQMILDIVQDYIVRCEKCHVSTNSFMTKEGAINAWNDNECTGPLELVTDDLEKNLESIKSLYVSNDDFLQVNSQSCDCVDIIIDTGEKLIYFEFNQNDGITFYKF